MAGVINIDFRGNVTIIVRNNTSKPVHIAQHICVSQISFQYIYPWKIKNTLVIPHEIQTQEMIASHSFPPHTLPTVPVTSSISTVHVGIDSCATKNMFLDRGNFIAYKILKDCWVKLANNSVCCAIGVLCVIGKLGGKVIILKR